MKNIFNPKDRVPTDGYKLTKWEAKGMRATAIAYLQREDLFTVENDNGNYYTLTQLQNAALGNK